MKFLSFFFLFINYHSSYCPKNGSKTITSSPGSSKACNAKKIPEEAPLVTITSFCASIFLLNNFSYNFDNSLHNSKSPFG